MPDSAATAPQDSLRGFWAAGAESCSPSGRPVPARGSTLTHQGRIGVVVDWDGAEHIELRPPDGGFQWDAPLTDIITD